MAQVVNPVGVQRPIEAARSQTPVPDPARDMGSPSPAVITERDAGEGAYLPMEEGESNEAYTRRAIHAQERGRERLRRVLGEHAAAMRRISESHGQ